MGPGSYNYLRFLALNYCLRAASLQVSSYKTSLHIVDVPVQNSQNELCWVGKKSCEKSAELWHGHVLLLRGGNKILLLQAALLSPMASTFITLRSFCLAKQLLNYIMALIFLNDVSVPSLMLENQHQFVLIHSETGVWEEQISTVWIHKLCQVSHGASRVTTSGKPYC